MDPRITETVTELIAKLGVVTDAVAVEEQTPHPIISITTAQSGRLIGNNGEHLRALNLIARKMVEHRFGNDSPAFLIDVNGYHKEHIRSLQQNARMLAERVRSLKTRTELSPMNAYERMIIHATFADDPELTTTSEGEGKDRHVVISYHEAEG